MFGKITNHRTFVFFFRNSEGTLKIWNSFLFLALMFVLLNTTVVNPRSSALAEDAGWIERKQEPRRGAIVDRQRRTLAGSVLSRDIMAVRGRMDPEMNTLVADFIAPHLGLDSGQIMTKLDDSSFKVKLVENMSEVGYENFCKFRYKKWKSELEKYYNSHAELRTSFGDYDSFIEKFSESFSEVVAVKNFSRTYPSGEVAAHIVGYSSAVQDDFSVWKGMELEYDELLRGVAGDVVECRDAFGRIIPGGEPVERGVIHGWDIRLTLSTDVQAMCYRILKERIIATGAKGGCVVVMDSTSGEIIAMVSYPTFDPVNYKDYINLGPDRPDLLTREEYRLNPMHNLVTQLVFEPGSVMKPLIAAWAYEKKITDTEKRYRVSSEGLKVPGKSKPIRDTHPPETAEMWSLEQVLVHSSNQGMGQIGMDLGREEILVALDKFGLGKKAIGLNEEGVGQINKTLCERYVGVPGWAVAREATSAFGQGVNATPIQVTAALNVFANSGCYVKPRIVLDASALDRDTVFYKPSERVPILSPETNDTIVGMLEKVVKEGTGTAAACEGYRVAGKTGTAEKPDPINGGYATRRHYASFAGFGPLPDPKYTVLVLMDEPQSKWGGSSCGPVFKAIFENLMIHDGISPEPEPVVEETTAE